MRINSQIMLFLEIFTVLATHTHTHTHLTPICHIELNHKYNIPATFRENNNRFDFTQFRFRCEAENFYCPAIKGCGKAGQKRRNTHEIWFASLNWFHFICFDLFPPKNARTQIGNRTPDNKNWHHLNWCIRVPKWIHFGSLRGVSGGHAFGFWFGCGFLFLFVFGWGGVALWFMLILLTDIGVLGLTFSSSLFSCWNDQHLPDCFGIKVSANISDSGWLYRVECWVWHLAAECTELGKGSCFGDDSATCGLMPPKSLDSGHHSEKCNSWIEMKERNMRNLI